MRDPHVPRCRVAIQDRWWWRSAALAVLVLGACSSDEGASRPPPACPKALFLDGATDTAAYQPGSTGGPDDLRHLAALTDLVSACRYNDAGVDVDLAFNVIAEKGPANDGEPADLTFFIATVGPEGNILDKQILESNVEFTDGEGLAGVAEELTLRLPSVTETTGGSYALFIGFQLDDAEMTKRIQPLFQSSRGQ